MMRFLFLLFIFTLGVVFANTVKGLPGFNMLPSM